MLTAEQRQALLLENLHDHWLEAYWEWRERRPDPGWRLDIHEGEVA